MRAKEFISENNSGTTPTVDRSLPGSYTIPDLSGADPYTQYRFGVAIAGAKGLQDTKDDIHPFKKTSDWGQSQLVIGYAEKGMDKWIDSALKQMGMAGSAKKKASTKASEETTDINPISPIKPFRGYEK